MTGYRDDSVRLRELLECCERELENTPYRRDKIVLEMCRSIRLELGQFPGVRYDPFKTDPRILRSKP